MGRYKQNQLWEQMWLARLSVRVGGSVILKYNPTYTSSLYVNKKKKKENCLAWKVSRNLWHLCIHQFDYSIIEAVSHTLYKPVLAVKRLQDD